MSSKKKNLLFHLIYIISHQTKFIFHYKENGNYKLGWNANRILLLFFLDFSFFFSKFFFHFFFFGYFISSAAALKKKNTRKHFPQICLSSILLWSLIKLWFDCLFLADLN